MWHETANKIRDNKAVERVALLLRNLYSDRWWYAEDKLGIVECQCGEYNNVGALNCAVCGIEIQGVKNV